MRRGAGRTALLLAGLALAAPLTATAAAARVPRPATMSVSRDAGAPRTCGAHQRTILLSHGSVACTHATPDPAPSRSAIEYDERLAPKCYGNGVNGDRVQLVYASIEGRPDDSRQWIPKIANEWAPAMEATFRLTSREQGRELGIRFVAPGCKLSVVKLRVPAAAQEADNMGAQIGALADALDAAGLSKLNRKNLVWYDGQAGRPHPCGVATGPVPDDTPTPLNSNNFGEPPVVKAVLTTSVAIAYKSPHSMLPDSVVACWGHQSAHTETHELLHTLGAVQTSSPNSNGLGHCRDEPDIMCYPEGGVKTFKRCQVRIELLDCGSDDYFNARATAGTYLSTHWNIANSSFLGAAAGLDDIPVAIPSP